MSIVLVVLIVLAFACSDDEATPTDSPSVTATPSEVATASPTATPKPTPTPTIPPELLPFSEFAGDVSTAVDVADAEFFSSRGVEIEVTCRGNEQLGPCYGQPTAAVISGIPGTAWRSDAFGLSSRDDFRTMISDWFASALIRQSDDYGAGAPRLAAIAKNNQSGEYYAIATLIKDVGPATGVQRQARVFRFAPVSSGDGWTLNGEILAAATSASNDWLSGQCSECYDYWEPWQGVAN